jgi:hypothetical protein
MRCRFFLAALLFAAGPATAEEAPEKAAATDEKKAAPVSAEIEIPVAIGQSVRGIRLPHYEKGGNKLSLRLNAESAERASETKFNFHGLRLELFDESSESPSMEVVLKDAVFDRETSILTSLNHAVIKGETFEITGRTLEFDSNTRASKLLGPVFMTISQWEEKAPR